MVQDPARKMPATALVIEDDQALANMVIGELKNAGVRVANHVDNGQDAWDASKQDYYDLIILDWKIPGISSLTLFNRFKQDQYYKKTPILVMSGYLKNRDFSLLGEYHNTASIEKPFGVKFLTQKIQILSKEAQWFNRQETKINDMIADLKLKNNLDIQSIQAMSQESPNPLPVAIIFGRTLRQMKFYEEAEQVLRSALQYNDHAVVLAELGKLCIETNKPDEAIAMLTRAAEKSPDNLERICNLGDLHLKNMDTDKARDLFSQAETIDPESKEASTGKVLAKNIEKWLSGAISVPNTFAGILNAIGINMVRSGNYENGIEHYQSALSHISDNHSKSKIYFNLGLGYLRWNKPREALPHLEKTIELNPDNEKAEKYLKKINNLKSESSTAPEPSDTETQVEDDDELASLDLDFESPGHQDDFSDDDDICIDSSNPQNPDAPEEFSNQDIELL